MLLWEREDRDSDGKAQIDRITIVDPVTRAPIRKLFRAIPGLRCHRNHYTYRTADGRNLWASSTSRMVPGLDLTDQVHIEHRTHHRAQQRHQASHDYYTRRDRAGIES